MDHVFGYPHYSSDLRPVHDELGIEVADLGEDGGDVDSMCDVARHRAL